MCLFAGWVRRSFNHVHAISKISILFFFKLTEMKQSYYSLYLYILGTDMYPYIHMYVQDTDTYVSYSLLLTCACEDPRDSRPLSLQPLPHPPCLCLAWFAPSVISSITSHVSSLIRVSMYLEFCIVREPRVHINI